jgi:alkyl sulfatase BDS1-like metallo-beta-lactamase superfamily hydrolase
VSGRYELRIDDSTFVVDGSSGSVRIRRGTADRPDATVTTDGGTFRAVIFGQLPIDDAVQAGGTRLDGDPDAISHLTDLLLTLTTSPRLAGAGRADEA